MRCSESGHSAVVAIHAFCTPGRSNLRRGYGRIEHVTIMKTQETTETRNGVRWGKIVGYGIAIGTVLGTIAGVATKHTVFIYVGMCLGAAIGAIFTSKQTKSD